MISIRLSAGHGTEPAGVLVIPVFADHRGEAVLSAEIAEFIVQAAHLGKPGLVEKLPRPLRQPSKVLLVGVGLGDEAGWRAAGAAIARAGGRDVELSVAVPADFAQAGLRGLAEGIWLGEYHYRLREPTPDEVTRLETVIILVEPAQELEQLLAVCRAVTVHVNFARDLINTPSIIKTPGWFVEQVKQRVPDNVALTVRDKSQLVEEGFGGILAVGNGSVQPPCLLQLSWDPPGATEHIVLVGKGITYDTGGIDIKPTEGMLLMRKDMSGAAVVTAATLAAAELGLPVKITALAPMAENMISGSAWRSGDVVRHYGGLTSEVRSTDAEGRVVLADAMAYAVAQLEPDLLFDLATLTGASRVALGKTTAALFSESNELAESLSSAGQQAGERIWRMPLADEYAKEVVAEIADLNNAAGSPGAITAALYLREFAGPMHDRWVHIDMSAPSWSVEEDGELARGATGWGIRTLVRWLTARAVH